MSADYPIYKRVNINDPKPVTPAPYESYSESQLREAAEFSARRKAERIWELLKQVVEGTNVADAAGRA